jgi:hypothetical protein
MHNASVYDHEAHLMAKGAQTTFRLPQELYEKLIKSAGTNHPIGEEIRQRLEASFETKPIDAKTRQLLTLVAEVADAMILDGDWHDDLHLFRVFKEAMLVLLSRFQPTGASPDAHYMMFSPDQPPEVAGRYYAGFAWRAVMNEKE